MKAIESLMSFEEFKNFLKEAFQFFEIEKQKWLKSKCTQHTGDFKKTIFTDDFTYELRIANEEHELSEDEHVIDIQYKFYISLNKHTSENLNVQPFSLSFDLFFYGNLSMNDVEYEIYIQYCLLLFSSFYNYHNFPIDKLILTFQKGDRPQIPLNLPTPNITNTIISTKKRRRL